MVVRSEGFETDGKGPFKQLLGPGVDPALRIDGSERSKREADAWAVRPKGRLIDPKHALELDARFQ